MKIKRGREKEAEEIMVIKITNRWKDRLLVVDAVVPLSLGAEEPSVLFRKGVFPLASFSFWVCISAEKEFLWFIGRFESLFFYYPPLLMGLFLYLFFYCYCVCCVFRILILCRLKISFNKYLYDQMFQ